MHRLEQIWILKCLLILGLLNAISGRDKPLVKIDPISKEIYDVDECQEKLHNCHSDELCENLFGAFRCLTPCPNDKKYFYGDSCHFCPDGFYIVNGICKDLDECKLFPNMCRQYSETCQFKPGHSICVHNCTGNTLEVNGVCFDVNECTDNAHHCQPYEKCRNTFGSYFCENANCKQNQYWNRKFQNCLCEPGFKFDKMGINCIDINECETRKDICSEHGVCTNLLGNYSCSCKSGFQFNGSSCVDINECKAIQNICQRLKCNNKLGGFECLCTKGYKSNEQMLCQDIDECNSDSNGNPCDNSNFYPNYKCVNFIGFHKCLNMKCDGDYKVGDNKICELSQPQCSFIPPKASCLTAKTLFKYYQPVQIIYPYNKPKFLHSISLANLIYNQFSVEINLIHPTGLSSHSQMFKTVVNSKTNSIDIYLNILLPVSTDFVAEVILTIQINSMIQLYSDTKLIVFISTIDPNYQYNITMF